MTKRQSRILMAAAAWTTYVWVSRLVIMAGQDESTGFKVVHAVLAVVSLAFGVAVGRIGWQNRSSRPTSPESAAEAARREQAPVS
jgi:hypothetical protein